MSDLNNNIISFFADGRPVPDLLTEDELVEILRIPHVSTAKNYHNVVKNLIRYHDLPRIQLCKRLLFPLKAVLAWIDKQTVPNMSLTVTPTADISSARKKKRNR